MNEEELAKNLRPTSIRIPFETMQVLDLVAAEKELSRSKVIINILDRYANAYRIDIKSLMPNSQDHYALIAPTLYGKTFMAKNLFIPACKKRILTESTTSNRWTLATIEQHLPHRTLCSRCSRSATSGAM